MQTLTLNVGGNLRCASLRAFRKFLRAKSVCREHQAYNFFIMQEALYYKVI
jgi:hypothetical protein